jgi:phosphoglucomutase
VSGTIGLKSSIGEVKKRGFSPLAGLKVVTASGWFAARPTGRRTFTRFMRRVFGTSRRWEHF